MRLHTVSFVALFALAACGTAERTGYGPDMHKSWESSDDPRLLADDLEYTFAKLPTAGAAEQIPWAANYWPTYRDNINHRWAGDTTQSPGEKFQEAFHLPGLVDAISAEYGIDSQSHNTVCTTTDDCNKTKGESCSKREGKDEGFCIETWFGICHAWAPAALMEKEPVKPVTFNGVEFKVNDIKALVSLSYDKELEVKFLSLRCNKKLGQAPDDATDAEKEQYTGLGEFGIPSDESCVDTNAGAFHVVITNFLGLRKQGLVEDRTIDYEVWNQPVRGFEVTLNEEVDAAKANELIGVTDGTSDYKFNDKAVSFRRIKLTLDWITESASSTDGNLASRIDTYTHQDRYEYIVELDAGGKVVGGEWVGASKTAHPDFLWLPTLKKDTEVAQVTKGKAHSGIKFSDVKLLLDLSLEGSEDSDAGGFDWGGACESGSGAFQQFIQKDVTVDVGDIPDNKRDVRIELKSDKDVDIQLIDVATGTELIAWPNGMLKGEGEECSSFEGVEFCYSGYNGVDGQLGNEWIEIKGDTKRTMLMKAFGYAAGDADVTYSWKAVEGCVDSGSGTFQQDIVKNDVVSVGIIPAGKTNIRIDLTSPEDVDVQLFDGAIPLVQWPDGRLDGAAKQTLQYEGTTIEWSGYNGGQSGSTKGNEYITIKGTLTRDLTMRAFGYAAGDAKVDYAWGLADSAL